MNNKNSSKLEETIFSCVQLQIHYQGVGESLQLEGNAKQNETLRIG